MSSLIETNETTYHLFKREAKKEKKKKPLPRTVAENADGINLREIANFWVKCI